MTAEQVSTRVLYVLVALAVVVFGAFFLIGYDVPYEDNPEFNAPQLTDLVLVFMYVLVLLAAILAVAAVAISFKARDKSQGKVNNIPAAGASQRRTLYRRVLAESHRYVHQYLARAAGCGRMRRGLRPFGV